MSLFVRISGGTIIAAMDMLKERGLSVQQIKVVSKRAYSCFLKRWI